MTIDFNKLIEFNNKHPDNTINSFNFILLNLLFSEVPAEVILEYTGWDHEWQSLEMIEQRLESKGFVKITGEDLKDVSIRDLGLELIGQSKSDSIIELANKIRDLFPVGVKSGGYPVRSSVVDIADKLRKFFKKHKSYTQEQVLEATTKYVNRKRGEGYSYMQKAVFFIEKDGMSTLASEIDSLSEENELPPTATNVNRML